MNFEEYSESLATLKDIFENTVLNKMLYLFSINSMGFIVLGSVLEDQGRDESRVLNLYVDTTLFP